MSYLCTETSKRREKNKPHQPQQRPAQADAPLVKSKGQGLTDVKVKEKDEFLFELGKYCYDLSKLVFGGVVLINVFHFEKDNVTEFIAGVSVMTGLFVLGAILTKRGSKKV